MKLVSIGVEICGMDYKNHDSKASLSEYDIIIFNADIVRGLSLSFRYFASGEPYLNRQDYESLKENCNYWSKELNKAYKNGKLIMVLAEPNCSICVHSGGIQYGPKNQQTYITSIYKTYSFLPFDVETRTTKGTCIIFPKNKYGDFIKPLYKSLEKYTAFKTEFSNIQNPYIITLTTKTGEPVGFIRENEKQGKYLVWPTIDFNASEFYHYDEKQGKTFWTKEGIKICKILTQNLINIYNSNKIVKEPVPEWITSDNSLIGTKEKQLIKELSDVEAEIQRLTEHVQAIQKSIDEEAELRSLLYSSGHELERSVNKALLILGLRAETYKHPDATLEIDNLIKYNGLEIIGETEGKESAPINTTKIGQLATNLTQYYHLEIDRLSQKPKGVLFGNPERFLPCSERTKTFTDKCLQISESEKIALVLTKELFDVAFYLSNNPNEEYKEACIDSILNTEYGIVKFPKIPE